MIDPKKLMASVGEMIAARLSFDQKLKAYHEACMALDWNLVDKLHMECSASLDTALDAVALAYREGAPNDKRARK